MLARAIALSLAAALAAPAAAEVAADAAKSYRLETEGSTASLRIGEKGRVVLRFVPVEKGVHVDPRAPLKIKVEASPGLRAEKASLGRADATDPKSESPRFEVPVVAVAAGAQEAKLLLDFFVCSDSWCVKQARTVAVPVQVR